MKRYLLISGIINSISDNDEHYISAHRLCKLYRLNPRECIFANKEEDLLSIDFNDLIILRPKYNGKYEVI